MRRRRHPSYDTIWARIRDVLTFLGGMGIMGYETLVDTHHDRPWLYAAALLMIGPKAATLMQTILGILAKFSAPGELPDPHDRDKRR